MYWLLADDPSPYHHTEHRRLGKVPAKDRRYVHFSLVNAVGQLFELDE